MQAPFVPWAGPVKGQAPDHAEPQVKAVNQALQGVAQEGGQAVPALAGTLEPAIIRRPCAVVVRAQQIGCRLRQFGLAQKTGLKQARRAAVAIGKGVNPGDVNVGDEGLEYAGLFGVSTSWPKCSWARGKRSRPVNCARTWDSLSGLFSIAALAWTALTRETSCISRVVAGPRAMPSMGGLFARV